MFHNEKHEKTRDNAHIPPLENGPTAGEEQLMQQPMDEQSNTEPIKHEQFAYETPTERAQPEASDVQPQPVSPNEPRVEGYRGASEQIPFYTPPASPQQGYGAPIAAQPERRFSDPGTFGQTYPAATPSGLPTYAAPTEPVAQPGIPLPPSAPRKRAGGLRTGAIAAMTALLAIVFAVGLFAGWQFGRSGGLSSPSSTSTLQPSNSDVTVPQLTGNNADTVREAVINKVQPAIVQINVTSPGQKALGSGVIIDKRGYIVTNNHVVENASTLRVTLSNGTVLPASVVGTDAADDLAVIKVTPPSSGLTTVKLGDSSKLIVGQGVLAIGSPLGNSETVTSGIVSALNRNVSEGNNGPTLPDAIQTDAPINPGNSGGALVDMQGNLIGMPTLNAIDTEFNTPANGLGFAIPVNRINFIATQIVADGHVTHTGRAILGVTVTSVDSAVAAQKHLSVDSGALIVDLTAGGPATSAGLKTGDVIVQVGNKTINSTSDISTALLQDKPGDSVAVKIYRGAQQQTVNVSLGELPAS
jgi:S1-C subfamily serine protease